MTAIIETGAGVALLILPSAVAVLLLGVPLETPAALTVARIGGAGLLALGVACWFARDHRQSGAAGGMVAAMLVYNALAVAVLGYAGTSLGLGGALLWPAVILHAGMGIWCLASMRPAFKVSANPNSKALP